MKGILLLASILVMGMGGVLMVCAGRILILIIDGK